MSTVRGPGSVEVKLHDPIEWSSAEGQHTQPVSSVESARVMESAVWPEEVQPARGYLRKE